MARHRKSVAWKIGIEQISRHVSRIGQLATLRNNARLPLGFSLTIAALQPKRSQLSLHI
jgi:hypothetical protein